MKVIELRTQNVKRLSAVAIRPDGSVVVVGGQNGAGKSSVLDSIMYALAGGRSLPAEPVRRGQKRAAILLDLGDLLVERTFDARGGSKLKVRNAKGATVKSPQNMLDGLCSRVSFDPLAFSRLDPKAQAKTLRELVGLDTTEIDLKRAKIYAQRTETKRDAKAKKAQAEAMPVHDNAPAEPVDVSALLEELEARQTKATIIAEEKVRLDEAREKKSAALEAVTEQTAEIADIEADLAEAKAALAEHETKAAEADERATLLAKKVEEHEDPNTDEIREQIATAEDVNKRIDANQRRDDAFGEADMAAEKVQALTDEIDSIDEEKAKTLGAADMPLDGLGFDEDGVTLEGLPLAQASSAEQLRLSVAMGLALNPKLRVLLIRDGSLLDADSLAMVGKLAEEADAQIWIERVGEGEECQVVIEDGAIRGAAKAPQSPQDAAEPEGDTVDNEDEPDASFDA